MRKGRHALTINRERVDGVMATRDKGKDWVAKRDYNHVALEIDRRLPHKPSRGLLVMTPRACISTEHPYPSITSFAFIQTQSPPPTCLLSIASVKLTTKPRSNESATSRISLDAAQTPYRPSR